MILILASTCHIALSRRNGHFRLKSTLLSYQRSTVHGLRRCEQFTGHFIRRCPFFLGTPPPENWFRPTWTFGSISVSPHTPTSSFQLFGWIELSTFRRWKPCTIPKSWVPASFTFNGVTHLFDIPYVDVLDALGRCGTCPKEHRLAYRAGDSSREKTFLCIQKHTWI